MNRSHARSQLGRFLLSGTLFIVALLVLQAFEGDIQPALERYARTQASRDLIPILVKMVLWCGFAIVLVRASWRRTR
jgi:hypothetical protein